MKRCPQCNRVETDEALKFCRVDGATLVNDSSSAGNEAGTADLSPAPNASEVHTSILPHRTDSDMSRPTAPTTVLPAAQTPAATSALNRSKRRGYVIALAVLIALVIAVAGYFFFLRNRTSGIESIAVLPFENRSGSSDTDYLSDGLADSLIYRLSQLPNLKVSPTSSVMKYKGKSTDVAGIAKELQVDAVMSGRLVQRGDDLSISVQLIDARNNKLIWAEQYERKMSDLLATQREIAASITQKLELKLSGADSKGITKHYTESNEAYQFYLKGRFYWNKRTGDNLKKAIEQFQQAANNDPNFALAYSGLADSYALLEEYAGVPSSESLPKARAAAMRAVQIDDSLAEAHASVGYTNIHSWHFAEGQKEFQRAIDLNPNYATAHQWYHVYFRMLGRYDEAFAEIKRAQQIDPLSSIISINVGDLYVLKGDVPSAIEEYKKVIEFDPNFARAHGHLGLAYLRQGRQQEALVELQKGAELSGQASELLSYLGYGFGVMGKRVEAMAVLKELEDRYAKRATPAVFLASVCLGLGDKDQAFSWLEKDFQNHTGMLTFAAFYHHFQVLRDDPRYLDLLRRMGLRS
jgi:TolB-like protein/Flp pilus assembly protein TadD